MNSAMNNEMALHYYCTIPAAKAPGRYSAQAYMDKISWDKLGIGWCASSLFVNVVKRNRARIRRPYSALFGQDRRKNKAGKAFYSSFRIHNSSFQSME